jgi:hypothetical protein
VENLKSKRVHDSQSCQQETTGNDISQEEIMNVTHETGDSRNGIFDQRNILTSQSLNEQAK